jgi:GntP family gluconate:H+ symporter
MQVNVGYFILAGTLFAMPATVAAYFWIKHRVRDKGYAPASFDAAELQAIKQLPPVKLALLPVIAPLLLITLSTLAKMLGGDGGQNLAVAVLHFIGQPVIALLVGALLSLCLLGGKGAGIGSLNKVFASAIEKSGPILIIIAGGGMFGGIIKETGMGKFVGEYLGHLGLGLAVPFLMTFLMKTALGSSTVAIITAASFIAPMLSLLGMDSESGRLFATLAMGAGSIMVSHANDPYFWVVTQFSEIKTDESLKVYSTATIVMGLTAFACIWAVSLFVL